MGIVSVKDGVLLVPSTHTKLRSLPGDRFCRMSAVSLAPPGRRIRVFGSQHIESFDRTRRAGSNRVMAHLPRGAPTRAGQILFIGADQARRYGAKDPQPA